MTVFGIEIDEVAELRHQLRHAAGVMEMLHVMLARRLQVDQHRHFAAELVERVEVDLVRRRGRRSRSDGSSPLVEPPIACSTTCALRNAAGVRISLGLRPLGLRHGGGAPCRSASAERKRSACGAGIVALIGSDSPSASVMQAMVLAVPITMQVPTDGARPAVDGVDLRLVDFAGAVFAPHAAGSRCRRPALRPCDARPPSARPE